MKVVAIIQARMGSSRLPHKVLADMGGKPMLEQIVNRVSFCKNIDETVVATTVSVLDDEVEAFAESNKINVFRGSEGNVLERYYLCAVEYNADVIVRLTGDNALIDSEIIARAISVFGNSSCDYLKYQKKLPLGMGVEIFTFSALESAYREADDKACLEHVTPYLYCNPDKFRCIIDDDSDEDYSNLRWTVDTPQDYELVQQIYQCLYPQNSNFSYADVLAAYQTHPQWNEINSDVKQKKVGYGNI